MKCEIVDQAEALAKKFVIKVETGRARSKETYEECKDLLAAIEVYHAGDKLAGFEEWWGSLDLHGAEASEDSIKSACVAAWIAARGGE